MAARVLLAGQVVRPDSLRRAVEPRTNFPPSFVRETPISSPLAFGLEGELGAGTGSGDGLKANARALEVPQPGGGLKTVTWAVLAVVKSLAGMRAVNRVLLTKLVVRPEPVHCTTEPRAKFEPITVSVKPEAPTRMLDGESSELSVGTRLVTAGTERSHMLRP